MLLKEEDDRQIPIYYISKVQQQVELNYTSTEKMDFALVLAARKLRQYFQARHIIVLTDHPLKEIMQKMSTSGRMVK